MSSTQRPDKLGEGGFTLLELMIVVAIVGILAAIAFTTYSAQVQKARRTDARTAVLDLAGREERYFSVNNSYSSTATQLGYPAFGIVGSGYYTLGVTVNPVGTTPSFQITATAILQQLADTSCASFSINQLGQQSSQDSGGADSTAICWAN